MISSALGQSRGQRLQTRAFVSHLQIDRREAHTASEFEAMGYKMVIWPVSSLRVANKAQEKLYRALKRDGGTQNMLAEMQTRAEFYATIGYHEYEALDSSIITSIAPEGMPQRKAD